MVFNSSEEGGQRVTSSSVRSQETIQRKAKLTVLGPWPCCFVMGIGVWELGNEGIHFPVILINRRPIQS
jgi:hypothetical protein